MLNRAEDRQLGPMQKCELVEVEGEIAMAEKNPNFYSVHDYFSLQTLPVLRVSFHSTSSLPAKLV